MAGWITHMIIADNLLQKGLGLDKRGFCVGNIAPDCNVENEDWTVFTPPREVTHWMTGDSKLTADYDKFYREYIKNKSFTSNEQYSFFIGYFSHLVTDVEFQKFVREEQRVNDIFKRIKMNKSLFERIVGESEDFDTLKRVFGKNYVFNDLMIQELHYLETNLDSGYITILQSIKEFPNYMDFFPKEAITRKIGIMTKIPENVHTEHDFLFFTRNEFEEFIDKTTYTIDTLIRKIN